MFGFIKKLFYPKHFKIALKETGVTEIPGPKSNERIDEYHKSCGYSHRDDVPWCSSFVNWCLEKAGIKGTKNPMARSWLNWGYPVDEPKKGDVVIFWRNSPDSSSGHVGFYVNKYGDLIEVLGGNQGNKVSYAYYSESRLLGYRRVKKK